MLKPLDGYIVGIMKTTKEQTTSGIILGRDEKNEYDILEITGLPEKISEDSILKLGEKVIIKKNSSIKIDNEKNEYYITKQENIMAICI